ncbi:uncharacterized protein TNCV_4368761 [Trichonephila clavipes]|nr:uncharacterized protein TNCV_4368761 [Trichonephila clavipes]
MCPSGIESIPVKYKLCNINGNRLVSKTVDRLRTDHNRGVKIDRDGRRTYKNCDNCSDTELTRAHIFDCPAIFSALSEIEALFSTRNLYADNAEQIARTGTLGL